MLLDDQKEKLQNDQEMEEEEVVSPESEEYFSEIRDRTSEGQSPTSTDTEGENLTPDDLSNMGGVSKDEEYHSEISRGSQKDMGGTYEADQDLGSGSYFETYEDDDEL